MCTCLSRMSTCLGRTIVSICLAPIILPLLLIQDLVDYYPIYIECYQYKKNADTYVKYENIPYVMRPSDVYYNSYKDKIAILSNEKMVFAYKYINKKTNKIVYVANDGDNTIVYDSELEQYKLKQPIRRLNC